MKIWNGTTTALGLTLRARSARPAWQSTTWASAGISLTGVWTTSTSYFFSFFFMVLATITLLPIPASQAMTTFVTSEPLIVVIPSTYFPLGLGRGHRLLGLGQIDVGHATCVVHAMTEAEQGSGDEERDDSGDQDPEDHSDVVTSRRHS